LGQVLQPEAVEEVSGLAPVLRVVQDDVQDRSAAGDARADMVDEGLVQALLVTQLVGEGGKDRVGALVAVDQRGR
jgi:hypothetical protein